METHRPCSDCGYAILLSLERCPHCARPGLFPNVRAAEETAEVDALDDRYLAATQEASARGCSKQAQDFETSTAKSAAVISRSIHELLRLASNENELYSTYYKLGKAEVRLPSGSRWDLLRRVADAALFPGQEENIRFAALTLDGLGLKNYGACSLSLRDDMIAHRTSVFEENSVLFMDHENIRIADADQLPLGRRAPWATRGRLCMAKLVGQIAPSTSTADFPGILLVNGATSAEDDFVEAHVWGPISIRTCDRIVVKRTKRKPSKTILKGLRAKLDKFGLKLEER